MVESNPVFRKVQNLPDFARYNFKYSNYNPFLWTQGSDFTEFELCDFDPRLCFQDSPPQGEGWLSCQNTKNLPKFLKAVWNGKKISPKGSWRLPRSSNNSCKIWSKNQPGSGWYRTLRTERGGWCKNTILPWDREIFGPKEPGDPLDPLMWTKNRPWHWVSASFIPFSIWPQFKFGDISVPLKLEIHFVRKLCLKKFTNCEKWARS